MIRSPSWLRFTIVAAVVTILGLGSAQSADDSKPMRALLVIGGCCHDYAAQKDILTKGISARTKVEWTVAYDPDTGVTHMNPVYESADWAKNYDVIVHDECTSGVKDLDIISRILEPHRQGLPAVVLHCAMHSYRSEGWPKMTTPWFEFTGLASTGHGPQVPIALNFIDKDHPITKGQTDWSTIKEELYNNFSHKLESTAQPLIRGKQTYKTKAGKEVSEDVVVAWTNLYKGKTKVFSTTLGHNNETVADPRYLDLVTKGMRWAVEK